MKYIFCFYLFFIIPIVARAEAGEMSSLLLFSENVKADWSPSLILSGSFPKEESDINDLLNMADRFMFRDYKKSLSYAKKASLLAEKNEDSEKKAWAYYYIIRNLFFLRELKEAYSYIEKAMDEETVNTKNQIQKKI